MNCSFVGVTSVSVDEFQYGTGNPFFRKSSTSPYTASLGYSKLPLCKSTTWKSLREPRCALLSHTDISITSTAGAATTWRLKPSCSKNTSHDMVIGILICNHMTTRPYWLRYPYSKWIIFNSCLKLQQNITSYRRYSYRYIRIMSTYNPTILATTRNLWLLYSMSVFSLFPRTFLLYRLWWWYDNSMNNNKTDIAYPINRK